MGHIYKIENKLNNHIYIGQTVKSVKKRFTQHKNNSNKEYFSQIVLYKAFNKYGIENFECTEIEEIPNELLDEREKYWIKYYDSYYNGYNSTLGGREIRLYDWNTEDIINRYMELKSARAVAKEIGCDHSTIDNILNANGIKRFTTAQQISKKTILKNEKEELIFETTTDAAKWLIENNITKSKSLRNVRQYINRFAANGKTYLGYEIIYGGE